MDRDREAFEVFCREKYPYAPNGPFSDLLEVWQAALAYARQNGEVCLSCGTHSMNARCDCTRLGSSELRRPAVCVSPPGKG